MIGIVVVSHSSKLAEGVCELAAQMAQGKVRLAPAGGTDDALNSIGTDAFKVVDAINAVYSDDGVLVFMDLGSAELSAATALELLGAERSRNVKLCSGPLVEGVIAAVGKALAGASPGSEPDTPVTEDSAELVVELANRLGLHARPAARLVQAAAGYQAQLTARNLTAARGPVPLTSINGLLSLGARQGHRLAITARGSGAGAALAAVKALIETGLEDDSDGPAPQRAARSSAKREDQIVGAPGAAGIAIGPLVHFRNATVEAEAKTVNDPEQEWRRLEKAIESAVAETTQLRARTSIQAGEKEAAIFDAHVLFLKDPTILESASRFVLRDRLNAAYAWQMTVREAAERLATLDDAYLRARAADVIDAGRSVSQRLMEGATRQLNVERPCIVAVHDVGPSEVQKLDPQTTLGLCLEAGGANAHSIILARAMEIPVVVGLGPALFEIPDGTPVALNGELGLLQIAPDADDVEKLQAERKAWLASREQARRVRHRPARTADGHRVRVVANLSAFEEAPRALESGAEGVGVLRTEFLFLNRTEAPSEQEQLEAYGAISAALGGLPLVIRTLDAGGDKDLPYLNRPGEANPFLGWRGIRVSLSRPEMFRAQLRAILRAGHRGRVEALFPMVSSLEEIRQAKEALEEARRELVRAGEPFAPVLRVGAMIEVPSAIAIARQLAAEVDFFSIGTNDLVQYVMAADRTNPFVAALADPFQPAVLHMVRETIQAAKEAGIGVTLCGELAADTLAVPLLVGLGVEELSVSVPLVPEVKQAVARVILEEAQEIAGRALTLDTSAAIRASLKRSR